MELTQLLNEARNARSYYRECLAISKSAQDAYDRLSRAKVSPIVERMSMRYYNAYIAARNAAIEAEQTYNLAVTALLDNEE